MTTSEKFSDVTVIERESDPINNYYIARKS